MEVAKQWLQHSCPPTALLTAARPVRAGRRLSLLQLQLAAADQLLLAPLSSHKRAAQQPTSSSAMSRLGFRSWLNSCSISSKSVV